MKRIISSENTFNSTKCPFARSTDTSYYDNFLNEKDLQYMQKSKNRDGKIVMMSPNEYYEACSDKIFKGVSVDSLKRQRNEGSLIAQYEEDMKSGDKFPLCYLNYADTTQEGLHRMMAAGNVYGWDTKFPVLVVTVSDERQEELHQIWRDWCDAVYEAKRFSYDPDNWEEEFVDTVQEELKDSTGQDHEVKIVYRRTPEEVADGYDYAIDILLAEFEDIMSPTTVFTPKLRKPEESSDIEYEHADPLDFDDLDDLLFL